MVWAWVAYALASSTIIDFSYPQLVCNWGNHALSGHNSQSLFCSSIAG